MDNLERFLQNFRSNCHPQRFAILFDGENNRVTAGVVKKVERLDSNLGSTSVLTFVLERLAQLDPTHETERWVPLDAPSRKHIVVIRLKPGGNQPLEYTTQDGFCRHLFIRGGKSFFVLLGEGETINVHRFSAPAR